MSQKKHLSVYLADLCYLHEWDNNQPYPLNVGYIASYLKKKIPDVNIEIFKDPKLLLERISILPPDVLGLSNYDWNTNLNVPILKYMREINPETITVLGGPNFEHNDIEWMTDFFIQRPQLDLYMVGEGEWSFTRLIELLLSNECKINKIPFESWPSTWYSFDRENKKILNNFTVIVDRLDLSTVPSPYLTGMLDPFLEDTRLAPIIETNRGCPYSCTFCCWGQATQSKVNEYPLDIALQEIEYAAQRCKNPSGFFYIADGNFGIFPRDQEIAQKFQSCTEKYSCPKRIFIYFAKNTNDAVINIAAKLKSVTSMSMSKQTLNDEALVNIKRKNIPPNQYDVLRRKCEERGISTFCELIYGLPGENYRSFVNGVIATIKDKQQVTMYPHIMIAGAEANSKEYREKHGIKTGFRVIPRYISSYGNLHSMEYEELVIETNDMTKEDFLQIRLFQFLVTFFAAKTFSEFTKSLRRSGLDYATLADLITADQKNWTPKWGKLLSDFHESTRKELLTKDQIKTQFTVEDLQKVSIHQTALIPFYMSTIASSNEIISDIKNYFLQAIEQFFGNSISQSDIDELKTTLELSLEKFISYDDLKVEKTVMHNYDLEGWLASDDKTPLENFHSDPMPYKYYLDDDIIPNFERYKRITADTREVVYRMRTNIIGTMSDRIFCYNRKQKSGFVESAAKLSVDDLSQVAVRL